MTDVAAAFPHRPLRILGSGAPSSLVGYVLGLVFLAVGAAIAFFALPALVRDFGIMQNPVVVQNASIRNAKCTTRKFIFVDCEATISYAVDGKSYTDSRTIFFLDMHSGNYRSGVVRSATRPQDATLSIAIDYFWDRVATAGGFAAVMLGLGVAGFMAGRRNARLGQTVDSAPVEIEAKPVELTEVKKGWGGSNSFTFKVPVGGKVRTFVSKFGKDDEPLASADGTCWAAIPAGSATAVLLDRDLARFDLTEDERREVWAAASGQPAAA